MTGEVVLFPAACAILIAAHLAGEAGKGELLRVVGKAGASFAFLGFGLLSGLAESGRPGRFILLALVLSVAGDLFLLAHGAEKWFLAGLASFLFAHIAFAVAFADLGFSWRGAAIGIGVAASAGILVGRWLLPAAGKMAGAVAAYIVAICTMIVCAAGAAGAAPSAARFALVGAAVVFAASDVLVARERFVSSSPWNSRIGLPLYYGAQLVFAGVFAAAVAVPIG